MSCEGIGLYGWRLLSGADQRSTASGREHPVTVRLYQLSLI